jgi:hypothetical protein
MAEVTKAPPDAGDPRRLPRGEDRTDPHPRRDDPPAEAEALPELPDEDDTPDDWDPFED